MSTAHTNHSRYGKSLTQLSAALLISGACVAGASGQSITSVGVSAGGSASGASAVSGDGSAVAVTVDQFGTAGANRWTTGGLANIGSLPGSAAAFGTAADGISRDGTAMTGTTFYTDDTARAYRWTSGGGMQDLGLLGGGVAASGSGISGDGSVVTGMAFDADFNTLAFRWTNATGMQSLGTLPGGTSSQGNRVSDDGNTIVGSGDTAAGMRAFRWTPGDGMQALSLMSSGDDGSNAFGVSANGSVIAGFSGSNAVLWTNGVPQSLGALPGDTNAIAYAVNGDGSLVGGYSFLGFNPRATMWSASLGMVDLNTYLPTLGIDLTGWSLQYTRGLSFDGTTLVGEGTLNGERRGWVVTIPSPASAGLLAIGGLVAARRRRA